MNMSHNEDFSEEELEILQEVMNIAFGQATSDLAELIDIYVVLSVPEIKLIRAEKLSDYIKGTIKDYKATSIVSQSYWGKFKGNALLVFPFGAGHELITMLDPESGEPVSGDQLNALERETLIEIGNILIGACIGKLTELLKDHVTYSPPSVINHNSSESRLFENIIKPDHSAITMNTVFGFEGRDINGYLFLINDQESIKWLKMALHTFMEEYE
jgi:chemotaxis protein CheC